jgi:sn-glycerol 3-phosphate transport system ATP-binding protein
MAHIELTNIKKSFGMVEVIKGVDLEIFSGEFMVFVGPSGCGKSTLLRLMAGLEDITSGDMTFDGKRVNALAPSKRGIAMVFQSYALYPHMTVFENMAFGMELAKADKGSIRTRVETAAELLQITPYLTRLPKQLSGGQRQRVAIGRAIVRDPKVFLFDEPLSNLDAQLRVQMRVEIKRLQQELATTSLYVTHDQVEAMTLADRLIVMNAGNVDQIGRPLDLYEHPATAFVAGFIGSPAMNLVAGRVDRGGVTIGDAMLPLDASGGVGDRPVLVGLRPEHLDLSPDGPLALRVELLERLGADTILHGRLADGVRMTARTAANFAPPLGDTTRFAIRPEQIHLFDPETGRRL